MPYKDPNRQKAYQRNWEKENREKRNAGQRRYYNSLRKRVLDLMGGKCIYCGCDEYKALEINHINGGGYQERMLRGSRSKQFYLDIVAGRRQLKDLELTCGVCNTRHKFTELKKIKGTWEIKWNPTKTFLYDVS